MQPTWQSPSILHPPPPWGRFRPARWTGRAGCAPHRHPLSLRGTAPSGLVCLLKQTTRLPICSNCSWSMSAVICKYNGRRDTDCVRGILVRRQLWSPSPWTASCVYGRGDGGGDVISDPEEHVPQCTEFGDLESTKGRKKPSYSNYRRLGSEHLVLQPPCSGNPINPLKPYPRNNKTNCNIFFH